MAAYFFAMGVVLILLAAVTFAFVAVGVNPVLGAYNKFVDSGHASQGTTTTMKWNLTLLTNWPGFALLGIGLAMVVRSIEVSNASQ